MFSRHESRPPETAVDAGNAAGAGLINQSSFFRTTTGRGGFRAADDATSGDERPEPEEGGGTLEDAARGEREYLRGRLRDELGREPSDEELSEWLRQHTEGY